MQTRDQALLDQIDEYNREDCIATLLLRDWLLELQRRGARGVRAVPAAPSRRSRSRSRSEGGRARRAPRRGCSTRARSSPAQLLDYHDRERKPVWWAFFDRLEMTPDELLEDAESIGGLELVGEPGAGEAVARLHAHVPGAGAQDRRGTGRRSTRRRGKAPGEILELDREARPARAQARPDARGRAAAAGAHPGRAVSTRRPGGRR